MCTAEEKELFLSDESLILAMSHKNRFKIIYSFSNFKFSNKNAQKKKLILK